MKYFAKLNNEDVEKWGVVGLLHDLDYEQFPEEHCHKVVEIMQEEGIDDFYIHAVCSHGYGICSDVKSEHIMEKVLFTIDELTGLINALCLMRPSKSVLDLEVKSVKKKFKDDYAYLIELAKEQVNYIEFAFKKDPLPPVVYDPNEF